jgi:hypothetical protein
MMRSLRRASSVGLLFLVMVLGSLVHLSCNPALSVAPPGSSMTVIPNPCRISASGGVSVISVVLYKDATGAPVADGTVVQFFTDLGTIDRQGKTNDGVARVNLTSDGRSGTARITAISGTGTTTSATPAPAPSAAAGSADLSIRSRDVSALQADSTTCIGTGKNQAIANVAVGGGAVADIFITASPNGIFLGRTSLITATVVDEDGNPIPNVPVFFSLSGGTGEERLSSGGSAVFTDNNGQAQDVVRTNSPGGLPKQLTITASAGGESKDATITVDP